MALCPRWTGSSLKAATGLPLRRCTEPPLTATFCTSFDWVGSNRLALVGTMQSCMRHACVNTGMRFLQSTQLWFRMPAGLMNPKALFREVTEEQAIDMLVRGRRPTAAVQ